MLISPSDIQGHKKTIDEIEKATEEGWLNLLYEKYQKQFGGNMSSNLRVPFFVGKNEHEIIVVTDARDAERLCNEHIKKVPNLSPYLLDSILSTTDNSQWQELRQVFTPAFSVSDSLKNIVPVSVERAFRCSDRLWEVSNRGRSEVNISEFFLNETLAQLYLGMFGTSEEFENRTNKKMRDVLGKIDLGEANTIKKFIEEIKKSSGPLSSSFVERMACPHSGSEDIGNAILFNFAGHDTTGHTLTWLIYELSKNKKVQGKLQDEIDKFWLEQNETPITFDDLKKLKYMTRCIQETMRLWPALPNGTYRELETDDYVMGTDNEKVSLEKGTWVQIPVWSRHRDPGLWGHDAGVFNPEREFQDDEIWDNMGLGTYNPSSERFSPFVYSPRDCLGKNFAQIEMRIILLFIIFNYRFSLTPQQARVPCDRVFFNGFTMGPRNMYNKNMKEKTNGMYVHVYKKNRSKL